MRTSRGLKLALATLSWLAMAAGAQSALAANNTLHYYGGPVAHSMNVVLVQWGSSVRPSYTDTTTGDPAFFSYLAGQSGSTTDIGGVLAQYMDTSGSNSQNKLGYGGMVQIAPPGSGGPTGCKLPSCVDDGVIQSQLQSNIQSSTLPAPAGNGLSTIYVVLFPPNVNVCQGGSCAYDANGFCAYHGSFPLSGSTHVLYAAMVDNGPNTPDAGLCGPSSNDLANQTDVAGHEFAEAINDPLVAEAATFGPPLSWYNSSGGEIGDICVGSNEQTSNGPWTVQKIWSNLDASCVGGESSYSAPTSSFLAPSTAAATQLVSFDGSGSSDPSSDHTYPMTYSGTAYSVPSGIASYRWNWGDGSPDTSSSTATASHAYSGNGNYNVSLTVTDDLGFSSTITHAITVADNGSAPAVSTGDASGVNTQGATVTGTINPEGQSVSHKFVYGTSPSNMDQSTPLTPGPGGTTSSAVSATLSGLQPATTYYYALEAQSGGNTYEGLPAHSFTTAAASGPPSSQTPTVSTDSASQISSTGAQLNGSIDPGGPDPVSYDFAYGTSASNLDKTTPQGSVSGGSGSVPVSATVAGLAAGTAYYYRLDVQYGGQTYSGATQTLTTTASAPSASTGSASKVTSTGAKVAGTVNPNGAPTSYHVEYGTSTSYGHSTVPTSAGSGSANVAVSVALTGLHPKTTYHYRLVATSAGGTALGSDAAFTTGKALAAAPKFSYRVLGRPTIASTLAHGMRVRFRCSKRCTAQFAVLVLPGKGVLQFTSSLITVGRGHRRIRSAGSASATLTFVPKVRGRLQGQHSLKLLISGYAVSPGSNASSPNAVRITMG